MKSTRNWLFRVSGLLMIVFAGSSTAPPAKAGDSAPMKCAANQDRVWVYESMGSFDVTAKLKCGETVEIIGRVKGFVKIHSASGVEGYVPESTFPNLPPFEDDSNKPPALAATLAQAAAKAHARPAASAPAPAPAIVASNAAPPSAAPKSVPVPVPAPTAAAAPAAAVSKAPAPSVAAVAPARAPAAPTPILTAVQVPASAPAEIVLSTAGDVRPATNSSSTVASASSTSGVAAQPTLSSASTSQPVKKNSTTSGTSTQQPAATTASAHVSSPTPKTVNSTSKTTAVSSAAKSGSGKSSGSQPPATGSTHSNSTPAPAAPPASPSNSRAAENTASLQSSRPIASLHAVAAVVESEDFPDSQPESESADPACQIFFSAYGLTPEQFKWVTQNRKKKFSNVCPAPDTSHVDFVMIFTHDVDFYGNTLPAPVHTDKNGFSDFSPMSMLDTTVTPLSEAEKARREYVYVFTMKRGAFDPSRFSPRRRYQFTKAESNSLTSSHASARTVEDAFHFMEEQGPSH
jgi:hypothetical protein